MKRSKYYRVVGINRQTGADVIVRVEAVSSANAKIKADRHGIEVTGIRRTKRPVAPPILKPWWEFQTLKSTGFKLPKGVWWFTALVALPYALVDDKNPFKSDLFNARLASAWLGGWAGIAMLIFVFSMCVTYMAWRLAKQRPGVAGNTYIIASVFLAALFAFASIHSQGLANR